MFFYGSWPAADFDGATIGLSPEGRFLTGIRAGSS
jgi:hypothetical protein